MEIWFLPWVDIPATRIGPIEFWKFDRSANDRIADASQRQWLQRYFARYMAADGQPVRTVTICSHSTCDQISQSDRAVQELHAAINMLAFSVIAPAIVHAVRTNNRRWAPPSSDAFEVICQRFDPKSDFIAVRLGSRMSGGLTLSTVMFVQPWSLGGTVTTPDPKLLAAFTELFSAPAGSSHLERISRVLEWFRLANAEAVHVSRFSKIVMLATAFEVLFQLANRSDKRTAVATELQERCADDDSVCETRTISGPKSSREIAWPLVSWWGYDFFGLRNAIVHGDPVEEKSLAYRTSTMDWLTHQIIGNLTLWQCLTHEMFSLGYFNDLRAQAKELFGQINQSAGSANSSASLHAFEAHFVASMLWVHDLQESLGWRRAPSRIKN